MLIWLLKDGEYLPVQAGGRPMRTWMLAEALVARGHEVVWWSSTFSHQKKELVAPRSQVVEVRPGLSLRMLHAGRYRRNVSGRRLLHHWRLGRAFSRVAPTLPRPDAIVCSYPVIDLAIKAADYAAANDVPLIMDIRDQWPTTFERVAPRLARPVVRPATQWILRDVRRAFGQADRLVAMSEGCLRWGLDVARRERRPADDVFLIGYPGPKPDSDDRPDLTPRMEELRSRVEGKTVFTFVGSFGHSYELDLLVEVATQLVARGNDDVHLVLAGDGLQGPALRKRSEGLPNLSLPGWLSAEEIRSLLGFSDVGLIPIFNFGEGTVPNKPFEYFAHGLPVISSLEGEMAQLLADEDLGLSYRCGDAAGLTSIVQQLAADPERRAELGANARRAFAARFEAGVIYDRYSRFVENLVEQRRGGRA